MHQTSCPFCDPGPESVIVYRDDLVYAMVSTQPINRYHVMVIPHAHHEPFVELPDPMAARVFLVAKRISQAVRRCAAPDAISHLSDDDIARTGFNRLAHTSITSSPGIGTTGWRSTGTATPIRAWRSGRATPGNCVKPCR